MLLQRKSFEPLTRLLRAAATAFAAFGLSASALAADIKVEAPKKSDDVAIIIINGEITPGDDEKFRKIASEFSDAYVLLNSGGGSIRPAMDIGRTIKLRGYRTAIHSTGSCASACALIWVAGSKRIIFEGGEVGFHASYLDTDGKKLATGVGNALVGLYLSQLGFGEKTVVFATFAPPDKILWLNEKTASMSGIDFDTIPDDEKAKTSKVAEMQPAPPQITISPPVFAAPRQQPDDVSVSQSSGYEKFMGDTKKTLRSPEAFVQALKDRGYQAKVSYDKPNSPMVNTGVGGEEIAVSFSGCTKDGCSYVQLLDYIIDATVEEADALIKIASKNEQYSHPIWVKEDKRLAFYNYIIIGSDGITIQTLIDNMSYFVLDNQKMIDLILDTRGKE
jgi:hypothetical protein